MTIEEQIIDKNEKIAEDAFDKMKQAIEAIKNVNHGYAVAVAYDIKKAFDEYYQLTASL